jgi:stage V sporulation protein AC
MQKDREKQQLYEEYVKKVTPTHSLPANMVKAFLVGGLICVSGQAVTEWALAAGMDEKTAGTWCSIALIFLSALTTGMNLYPRLAKWGGAGTLVPITGFANGVCAPIVEFQTEGEVFGKGVKAFTIAGPVILYGIFTSWLLGVIYWIVSIW